jgi:tol-pal system protein YbgF
MGLRSTSPSVRIALAASAVLMAAVAAAGAQTIISTAPPDPLVEQLRDRVNALEGQVRTLTGENERLQFELRQAKDDNVRLQRTIDDLNAQAAQSGPGVGVLGTLAQSQTPPTPGPAGAAVPLPGGGDPAASFNDAYALVQRSDNAGAQAAFAAFLAAYPGDTRAPNARYWLGQVMLAQGANSDAASQFLTVVQKSAKADIAPDALVRLGVALNRMGEKAQACTTLKSLSVQFPKAKPETKTRAQAQIRAIGC